MKRILKGKGVKKYRQSLVFGRKIVSEVLKKHTHHIIALVAPEGISEIDSLGSASGIGIIELSKGLFKEIDLYRTKAPFLLVSRPEFPPWKRSLTSGCTLFVPFQDPENVGAVIRSAVAFGVAEIVILQESADPFHPKSIRSSSGAVFSAPLSSGPSIRELGKIAVEEGSLRLFTLHMEGYDIRTFQFPEEPFGLLPGLEGPGIGPLLHNLEALKIPMLGPVESLNAATAVAIALYEWSRRFILQ